MARPRGRGRAAAGLLGLLAAALLVPVPCPAGEAGRELAQRVYDRPDGRDVTLRARMVLQDPGRPPRTRTLFSYRLDLGEGEVRSLVRFVRPADIDGVGLLTRDHRGASADQWLYLPALGKVRRIAGERRGGRFVGSDLFFEDLREREPGLDRHRLRGEAEIAGTRAKVLVSVPVDPASSTYSKRILWIHPQALIPLRVDFFRAGREAPIKRLRVHRIERIGGYWTVMDSTMTDLRSSHRTRIRVKSVVYDRGLPRSLFSRRVLADPERERGYRP
ncbi:MAG TPA: outer membrane lipoprotein-sorting protein [Gammaproteobacteria bacterium]|nr:outer membrane lipoprotein-sorting protein [Gammaproteobacteria bacterium]